MCDTCGCGNSKNTKTVDINQSLLKKNEDAAIRNRKHFDEKGLLVINLISSPGSGKTTLLEKTIEKLKESISIGVLEGDIETELDAERIRAKGVPAVQLTTGGSCHLESALIHKGFHELEKRIDGNRLDVLFIENVGNLVCPAFFDLGEHIRAVLISVPEGPDKPVKYPRAIRTSHVLVISKSDLLPYFDFNIEQFKKDALSLNPHLRIIITSAMTGEGIDEWCEILKNGLK
ncbi:MAG: hydrogenase nickel incorporation protein HypB [Nitrospiraceae bacterium]|nr:MAG: hydrogenase nickel incorporation protein HypB [Nitrospiraceae bacterium]